MTFRLPQLSDEQTLRLAHEELALDNSNFLLDGYEAKMNFGTYIIRVKNSLEGVDLLPGRVQSTFLILEIENEIVGRVSIRHELNDWLSTYGGHVGYAVRPAFRRQGYARQLLAQGLAVCANLGIDHALLTCNDSNVASRRVIETAGGDLINIVQDGEHSLRRYSVPTH